MSTYGLTSKSAFLVIILAALALAAPAALVLGTIPRLPGGPPAWKSGRAATLQIPPLVPATSEAPSEARGLAPDQPGLLESALANSEPSMTRPNRRRAETEASAFEPTEKRSRDQTAPAGLPVALEEEPVKAIALAQAAPLALPDSSSEPPPPPVVVRPGWLPSQRPIEPVVPEGGSVTKPIVYEGETLEVPESVEIAFEIPEPVNQVYVLEESVGRAYRPEPAAESPAPSEPLEQWQLREEGPVVDFSRLVARRLRELEAYGAAGQQSEDGIGRRKNGKYFKGYYRFPLRGISVAVTQADPLEMEGEIRYERVLFIQSTWSKKTLLKQRGKPHEDTTPLPVTEKYRYRKGTWSYVPNAE